MMQEPSDLLAHRLNFDAIVFCGCSMKEMHMIVLFSLSFCILILGGVMKLLIHMFLVGVGLSFPLAVGLSWSLALMLQRIKQGKPQGYVKQRFLLRCEDYGLISTPYLRRSGTWSVGR